MGSAKRWREGITPSSAWFYSVQSCPAVISQASSLQAHFPLTAASSEGT